MNLQGCVLVLGEDGIVGLEIILLEQLLAVIDLDVKEGVAQAEERVGLGGHGCSKWTIGHGAGGEKAGERGMEEGSLKYLAHR